MFDQAINDLKSEKITISQLYSIVVGRFDNDESTMRQLFVSLTRVTALAGFAELPDPGITSEFTQTTLEKLALLRIHDFQEYSSVINSQENIDEVYMRKLRSRVDHNVPYYAAETQEFVQTSTLSSIAVTADAITCSSQLPESEPEYCGLDEVVIGPSAQVADMSTSDSSFCESDVLASSLSELAVGASCEYASQSNVNFALASNSQSSESKVEFVNAEPPLSNNKTLNTDFVEFVRTYNIPLSVIDSEVNIDELNKLQSDIKELYTLKILTLAQCLLLHSHISAVLQQIGNYSDIISSFISCLAESETIIVDTKNNSVVTSTELKLIYTEQVRALEIDLRLSSDVRKSSSDYLFYDWLKSKAPEENRLYNIIEQCNINANAATLQVSASNVLHLEPSKNVKLVCYSRSSNDIKQLTMHHLNFIREYNISLIYTSAAELSSEVYRLRSDIKERYLSGKLTLG